MIVTVLGIISQTGANHQAIVQRSAFKARHREHESRGNRRLAFNVHFDGMLIAHPHDHREGSVALRIKRFEATMPYIFIAVMIQK